MTYVPVWLMALLLLFSVSAAAQPQVIPTQSQNSANQQVVSAANTSVAVTLTAPIHTRVHLYSLGVRCSAGTAGVTITAAGTTIWSSATGFVNSSTTSATWIPALAGGLGQVMVVTLSSCGAGNAGTLNVQADIF